MSSEAMISRGDAASPDSSARGAAPGPRWGGNCPPSPNNRLRRPPKSSLPACPKRAASL